MIVSDKKILIIGMAKSGISAGKMCSKLGANVNIYDQKDKSYFINEISELTSYNFEYFFGEFDEKLLEEHDILVLSPGVPKDLWFIEKAKSLNKIVIGEFELAYLYCKAPVIGITGTNGKTSTTSLVGEIISTYNKETYVVGNIGNPFSEDVLSMSKDATVIAEISSFQLEEIKSFKPKISAILNITEDHLNRHKTFENYIDTKLLITQNQREEDFCILNYDDSICRQISDTIKAQIVWFSMKEKVHGVYIENKSIMCNISGEAIKIIDISDIKLLGSHMIQNIMAGIGIAYVANVPVHLIKQAIIDFKGVEHRIEYITTKKGVKYYNDSKATNPDAAIKGIDAMITPTVLIGGGMDKGSDFKPWIEAFNGKVKSLILFGETKGIIAKTAYECFFNDLVIVEDLEEAVQKASELAITGDSVLLSPACASWDMFKSFEERGDIFKSLVKSIE